MRFGLVANRLHRQQADDGLARFNSPAMAERWADAATMLKKH